MNVLTLNTVRLKLLVLLKDFFKFFEAKEWFIHPIMYAAPKLHHTK